jgi:hypothetical protein
MTVKRLIGSAPSQVSRNRELGRLAWAETAVVPAPASATSAGIQGQIAEDDNFFYVCIATNTWKRVAISTW